MNKCVQLCSSMINSLSSASPAQKAQARIHQAALRLFAERGQGDLAISDLAEAAGIARGTVYNNIADPQNLFGQVAGSLAREMIERVEATMGAIADPPQRLATGCRLFVRRAHEEQDWGRFLVRFGLGTGDLRHLLLGPPVRDIAAAMETGRFKAGTDKIAPLVCMLTGMTLTCMDSVMRGDQAWREAGSGAAELFLIAGGMGQAEARRIARSDLPPLAAAPHARSFKGKEP